MLPVNTIWTFAFAEPSATRPRFTNASASALPITATAPVSRFTEPFAPTWMFAPAPKGRSPANRVASAPSDRCAVWESPHTWKSKSLVLA